MSQRHPAVYLALGFAVGAVAAAVAVALTTPVNGAEARSRLLYEGENALWKAQRAADKARERAERLRGKSPREPAEGEEADQAGA